MILYLMTVESKNWQPIKYIDWKDADRIRTGYEKAGYGVMLLRVDEAIQKKFDLPKSSESANAADGGSHGK